MIKKLGCVTFEVVVLKVHFEGFNARNRLLSDYNKGLSCKVEGNRCPTQLL